MLGFRLLSDAGMTFARVFVGWASGAILGIAVGLLMSASQMFLAIGNPIIEILRPLPPIALIPFFIIWFGLGISGQIGLIALGSLMVLAVTTYAAVNNVASVYVRAAASLGASRIAIYRWILLPAATPSIGAAFRVSAALAFATGVAAEFMGAQSGLGFLIMVARRTLNTNTILLGTLLLAAESYLMDIGIRAFNAYLCRWSESPVADIRKSRAFL